MRKLGLALLSLLILVTNANAQQAPEICYGSKQNYTPVAATVNPAQQQIADVPIDGNGIREENRLSYWAYRHNSLHERGIVDQILKRSSSNCCGGTSSGECRVSRINMLDHTVLIDGEWCPLNPDVKPVIVEGLANDEEVVVCAGQTMRSFPGYSKTLCPLTYCIGERGGS